MIDIVTMIQAIAVGIPVITIAVQIDQKKQKEKTT